MPSQKRRILVSFVVRDIFSAVALKIPRPWLSIAPASMCVVRRSKSPSRFCRTTLPRGFASAKHRSGFHVSLWSQIIRSPSRPDFRDPDSLPRLLARGPLRPPQTRKSMPPACLSRRLWTLRESNSRLCNANAPFYHLTKGPVCGAGNRTRIRIRTLALFGQELGRDAENRTRIIRTRSVRNTIIPHPD